MKSYIFVICCILVLAGCSSNPSSGKSSTSSSGITASSEEGASDIASSADIALDDEEDNDRSSISHFEDGTVSVQYENLFSLDIPSGWRYRSDHSGHIYMYPKKDNSTFCGILFNRPYSLPQDDASFIKTTENWFRVFTKMNPSYASDIYNLENGSPAGLSISSYDNINYLTAYTIIGKYEIILDLKTSDDLAGYGNDIDKILSSIVPLPGSEEINDVADAASSESNADDENSAYDEYKPTTGERNALKKAKEYLRYTSFSYSGLVKQLEYEGFSNSEAVYGVDNCGADWNEQAAKKAKEYLDYSSFSRSGLVEQLEYEGFTHDQAEYGVSQVYD